MDARGWVAQLGDDSPASLRSWDVNDTMREAVLGGVYRLVAMVERWRGPCVGLSIASIYRALDSAALRSRQAT
jgi:hypothetical protein